MLDKFEAAALEAIQKAMQAVTGSGKLETRILNAEYNMGRFSALIEIIEGINTERFVSVADQTKTDRDTILKFIEKVYNIRAETKSWKQGSVGARYNCRIVKEVVEK